MFPFKQNVKCYNSVNKKCLDLWDIPIIASLLCKIYKKYLIQGVSVTILDDGVERSHPDLTANYDPLASFDVNEGDNDPTPRYDLIDSNRHGESEQEYLILHLLIL